MTLASVEGEQQIDFFFKEKSSAPWSLTEK